MSINLKLIINILLVPIFLIGTSLYANESLSLSRQEWISSHKVLLETKPNYNDVDSIIKFNLIKNTEWKKRMEFCSLLAKEFLAGNIYGDSLDSGFKTSPHYQSIMNTFSMLLIREAIEKLKLSRNPAIEKLMNDYQKTYGDSDIPLFRLTGAYIDRESPTEEKGGFHRGSGSIFMDLTRTSSGEFLFIFMHELFHSLDKELFESSRYFSEQSNFEEMVKTSQKYTSSQELSSSQQKKLDLWITAGLNRGLFAEWRAWCFGFNVYQQGIKEKLWNKIPFVEQVLGFKGKNESISQFTYRYLNERSQILDPLFNSPLFKEAIESARENFVVK